MKNIVTSLLSLILVAACAGTSLKGYQAPVYEVIQPVEKTVNAESTTEKKKEKTKATTAKENTVEQNSVTPRVTTVKDASSYKDGTYYGTGTGFAGTIKVKVVIKSGKISSIDMVSHSDGGSYMSKASALLSRIVSKQSTNVDTVSGATYSSAGLIKAVRNALSQAAVSDSKKKTEKEDEKETTKKEDTAAGKVPYLDGVYYGTAEGYLGDITVAVVIQNKTITAILLTETEDDDTFVERAKAVIDKVLKKQSAKVDTVSGATYSSEGILNAIKNALSEAKKATDAANKGKEDSTTENGGNTTEDTTENGGSTTENSGDTTENNGGTTEGTTENGGSTTENNGSSQETVKKYMDGTYDMVVLCEPDSSYDFDGYHLHMKVQIKNDKITAITNVYGDGDEDNDKYITRAVEGTSSKPGVVAQILGKGLPEDIDVVSRATCTSKSIIEACKQALEKALR